MNGVAESGEVEYSDEYLTGLVKRMGMGRIETF